VPSWTDLQAIAPKGRIAAHRQHPAGEPDAARHAVRRDVSRGRPRRLAGAGVFGYRHRVSVVPTVVIATHLR
jgi:hypothetical protein